MISIAIITTKRGPVRHLAGCRHVKAQLNKGITCPVIDGGTAVEILGTRQDADGVTYPAIPRDVAPCLMEVTYSPAFSALGLH